MLNDDNDKYDQKFNDSAVATAADDDADDNDADDNDADDVNE